MAATTIIQLHEQISDSTQLNQDDTSAVLPNIDDGKKVEFSVKRGKEFARCLCLRRAGDKIFAAGSYYVGIDWIAVNKLAVQVSPKMNNGLDEIDYVAMLNEALHDPENYKHLADLVTIKFSQPSIEVTQQQDILSLLLITEYLNMLQAIVRKGLMCNYRTVEENLRNKVKGHILIAQNVKSNLTRGRFNSNECRFQVYDIDTPENRILKKALQFSKRQLQCCGDATCKKELNKKAQLITPYFAKVGDTVSVKTIQTHKGNPVFKEYSLALRLAQLLLRRYSYNITQISKQTVTTPPFWIDMSKLFELYVFKKLRDVFTSKEVFYHVKEHWQELDYLLNPHIWPEPYVIDAKYKPQYGENGIEKNDARQVSGYARLASIYKRLKLEENTALPIKCLIIYPDQNKDEDFTFTRDKEPEFEKFDSYIRTYKVGIKLPVVAHHNHSE